MASVAGSIIKEFLGGFSHHQGDYVYHLEQFLTKLKGEKPIIIIVKVNNGWKTSELKRLFEIAEDLGASKNLVQFVVIMSPPLVDLLEIERMVYDYRVVSVIVGEATEKESYKYFDNLFSSAKCTTTEKHDLAKMAVNNGFLNFMKIKSVAIKLKGLFPESSVECIKKFIEEEASSNYRICKAASKDLIRNLKVTKGSKKFELMKKVAEGEHIDINIVLEEWRDEEFCNILYEVKPHPLTIQKHEVFPASKMMAKALKETLSGISR